MKAKYIERFTTAPNSKWLPQENLHQCQLNTNSWPTKWYSFHRRNPGTNRNSVLSPNEQNQNNWFRETWPPQQCRTRKSSQYLSPTVALLNHLRFTDEGENSGVMSRFVQTQRVVGVKWKNTIQLASNHLKGYRREVLKRQQCTIDVTVTACCGKHVRGGMNISAITIDCGVTKYCACSGRWRCRVNLRWYPWSLPNTGSQAWCCGKSDIILAPPIDKHLRLSSARRSSRTATGK
jgi:hypothetical protein